MQARLRRKTFFRTPSREISTKPPSYPSDYDTFSTVCSVSSTRLVSCIDRFQRQLVNQYLRGAVRLAWRRMVGVAQEAAVGIACQESRGVEFVSATVVMEWMCQILIHKAEGEEKTHEAKLLDGVDSAIMGVTTHHTTPQNIS